MSSAHRPTWNPARGSEGVFGTRVGPSSLRAHTVLKLRRDTPASQDATKAPVRRDLKAELERAERAARNKRRLDQGLEPEPEPELEQSDSSAPQITEQGEEGENEQEPAAKRRRLIQEVVEADAASDDVESYSEPNAKGKDKTKASDEEGSNSEEEDSDESDSDSDEEEDDTAALVAELEKIKRERTEEKERKEKEAADLAQSEREDEIALGNPLLNLEQAVSRSEPNFGVKRRWDDDVIFKNQAAGVDKRDKSSYINDMTRTEFHKKFLYRFIK